MNASSARPLHSTEVDKGSLTERERDVLRLLEEGHRIKDVAGKLGIDTLPGLVKFAIRAGIITPGP